MNWIKHIPLLLLFLCSMTIKAQQSEQTVKPFIEQYLAYVPEGYDSTLKAYPLVIFLHGSGERGDNLEKVKIHGIPRLIAEGKKFPFIVIAPQCPDGVRWNTGALKALYDEVLLKYRVDIDRVYLTGLSMGAFGAWDFAIQYPELFAALIPISGGGNPREVCAVSTIPTWVFHGEKDDVVPLFKSADMVEALEACNGKVTFTTYPNANHDAWTETYASPQLYEWMLLQKRSTPWDKDWRLYQRQEQRSGIKKNGTLFLGSSTIKRWKYLESQFRNHNPTARGFRGITIANVDSYFFPWIYPYQPKRVILYLGDNDIATGLSPLEISRAYESLIQKFERYMPQTEVWVISVKPSPLRRRMSKGKVILDTNARLKQMAESHTKVRYIDLYSLMVNSRGVPDPKYFVRNGLYLSKEGYKLWQKTLSEKLSEGNKAKN
ncbi:GDSL-type esterase/lipase family protein [Cytophagales bacterium LB-30]|uniref:GDSL-type esterase/lipase family protein n=1 Tax=Shiella aurantiaca TaxID=3058365 RepID=A0ABT8F214_9BACT|nr:GDSL-type esterase/lipase family protein [Shiella aurantiaca]MDN4164490.1 GDSL-type esterase/lipase family protein [Shiella aurantiaca]